MELENKWNSTYLLQGRVTVDMKSIEEEIRIVRRRMISADYEDIRLAQKDYRPEVNELVANG